MGQNDAMLRKEAMVPAMINGVINAGITWFSSFGQRPELPLTINEIRAQETTVSVFGQGVLLALLLCLIQSAIVFKSFGGKARKEGLAAPELLGRPFLWWGLRVAARNSLAAFGLAVALAVLWQWSVGTVYVSNIFGTLIVAAIAAAVSYYAGVKTMQAMLRP